MLLADPRRHPELDGSGTLRSAPTATPITAVGDEFVMQLQANDLGSYRSRSIVVRYEPDRAIGWSPGPINEQPFGHTYDLHPRTPRGPAARESPRPTTGPPSPTPACVTSSRASHATNSPAPSTFSPWPSKRPATNRPNRRLRHQPTQPSLVARGRLPPHHKQPRKSLRFTPGKERTRRQQSNSRHSLWTAWTLGPVTAFYQVLTAVDLADGGVIDVADVGDMNGPVGRVADGVWSSGWRGGRHGDARWPARNAVPLLLRGEPFPGRLSCDLEGLPDLRPGRPELASLGDP